MKTARYNAGGFDLDRKYKNPYQTETKLYTNCEILYLVLNPNNAVIKNTPPLILDRLTKWQRIC
ncbi:MAG TPA: hypothetical protein VGD14_11660 [bacterium]